MSMKKHIITVLKRDITIINRNQDDLISVTDIAKSKNKSDPNGVIANWLRNRSTIEFLGLWEKINNSTFDSEAYNNFLFEAGSNSFTLSPKRWIETTNAKGMIVKAGRGGGTFTQKDIAFEFAAWISAEFKLYLIKEFQRLKDEENDRLKLNWNLHRTLAKINYRIHTDAIKENLLPKELRKEQISHVYANEADLLNMALYGITAADWRASNPEKDGNIRDHSSLEQLLVLANMESINAELIRMELSQKERIVKLNEIARQQMKSLLNMPSSIKKLK